MTVSASTCDSLPSPIILPNFLRTAYQWRMANSLLLATAFRVVFVILSYGCKVPAGIFVPSMAIGATFGRMVGIIVKAIYRSIYTTFPMNCLVDR